MTERRDSQRLGAEAEALLQALRVEEDMPPAAQARVWRRLATATEEAGSQGHVRRGMSPGAWAVVVLAAAAAVLLASRAGVLGPLVAERGGEAAKYSKSEVAPAPVVARPAGAGRGAEVERTLEHVREDVPEETATTEPRARTERPAREAKGRADDRQERASTSADEGPERASTSADERPERETSAPAGEEPQGEESSLAEEAGALGRAQAAIQGGRADAALEELAGYARRFPRGTLREEYEALRTIALCEAGRTREGRGEAQAFLRDRSGSALGDRVRRACLESQ